MASSTSPPPAITATATPSSASAVIDKGSIGLPKRKRRFSPLDPEKRGTGTGDGAALPELKGIVFDVDGTLW